MRKIIHQITHWELWPFYIIYAPLGIVWLYYAIRAKAFWFFSAANPTLEFSGFEGEGKKEMYDQIPPHYFPKTIYIIGRLSEANLISSVIEHGFSYPFIVKPEVGMQGMLFRKIENEEQLLQYHKHMPFDYLIQELVDYPMEFSVFHIRYPNQQKGIVTGFILKDYLAVVGDGKSTLLELIQNHPKAKFRLNEMMQKHQQYLNEVINTNEKYYLSIAGNHNRGARFINLHHLIDADLNNVFDKISNEIGHFYYGRYDLKCTSIEDLKQGKNIQILEYNGAGAEPNHIYDCGMSYVQALKIIVAHWEHLYQIAKINVQEGRAKYWSFWKGRKYLRRAAHYFHQLKMYDLTLLTN